MFRIAIFVLIASLLEGIPTGNILLPPDAAAGWVKEFFPPAKNQGQ